MKNTTTGATGKWFGIQYIKSSSSDRLTWAIDDDVTKTDLNVTPGSTYFNNAWHHLVAIRDVEADQLRIYIDGVLKGSKTDGTGNIAQVENLVLGNTNVNLVNAFGGSLDDVSIYKGVLTAEEVLENYNNGIKTGIYSPTATNAISSFPNPFVDEINLQSDKLTNGNAIVRFYSVAGQLVLEKQTVISNNQLQVKNLDMLTSGAYICTVKTVGNELLSVRVIK